MAKRVQVALTESIASLGKEGWHNNHHAFPNSAKQGLFKGQIDITWEHIKILAKFGFAKKVKLPSRSYY